MIERRLNRQPLAHRFAMEHGADMAEIERQARREFVAKHLREDIKPRPFNASCSERKIANADNAARLPHQTATASVRQQLRNK